MEEKDMQKNKYITPSVEVVSMYMEQNVLLGTSNEWTDDMGSQKRRPNQTSSSAIWENSINNQE